MPEKEKRRIRTAGYSTYRPSYSYVRIRHSLLIAPDVNDLWLMKHHLYYGTINLYCFITYLARKCGLFSIKYVPHLEMAWAYRGMDIQIQTSLTLALY
jgi:hypothetical protein